MRQCIEKPAETCVLFFAPGLVERLLDEVEHMPGALPMLSVTLRELFLAYVSSGREDRTISLADYRHMGGGVAGTLQQRAELVFTGIPSPREEGPLPKVAVTQRELPAFQRTLRNVMLRMVSPEGRVLTRRRVFRSELEFPQREENARVHRVLRTLEANRLVVSGGEGAACVEPAHDALFSAWPRLQDWAFESRRELLLQRRLSHAATEWHQHKQASELLWADARLDQLGLAASSRRHDALSSHSPEPLALNSMESRFVRASETRRRFLRYRRDALTVAVTLLVPSAVALFLVRRANVDAAHVHTELLPRASTQGTQTPQWTLNDEGVDYKERYSQRQWAEANAREAQRSEHEQDSNTLRRQQDATESNRREALRQQEEAAAKVVAAMRRSDLARIHLEEVPERTAVGLEELLRLLQLAESNLEGDGFGEEPIASASFSPDNAVVLTASEDGTALVWRTDGSVPSFLVAPGGVASSMGMYLPIWAPQSFMGPRNATPPMCPTPLRFLLDTVSTPPVPNEWRFFIPRIPRNSTYVMPRP
ncbi:WD40 repeat domain-containing protein [Melittangium boletus]|uniref:WD40 repeat domain-containing protein n=1 Tax=Melittangium boletus TaxID=83453 RepID=UPI003DA3795A